MGALGRLTKGVQNQQALRQDTEQDMAVGQVGGAMVAGAQQQANVPGDAQALTQGGEELDPKLKKKMEGYQSVMMKILHAKETRGDITKMLSNGPPEQSIPATALQVNKMVEQKVAKGSGQPVEAAVKVAGAVYLVQDLVEIGKAGGMWEQPIGPEASAMILEETMKQYIHQGLKDGSIDPVELQKTVEPMMNGMQNEVGGMIAQEAGLPPEPTAGMGVNKIVQDKTRPLEQENSMLKGQLKKTTGPPQGQPGQPQQGVQ